jgi:hypothetical protein
MAFWIERIKREHFTNLQRVCACLTHGFAGLHRDRASLFDDFAGLHRDIAGL